MLRVADEGEASLLVLLDLSAAFDTLDYPILLQRLVSGVGAGRSALAWFSDFLAERTQTVRLGAFKSRRENVSCGEPQGSPLSRAQHLHAPPAEDHPTDWPSFSVIFSFYDTHIYFCITGSSGHYDILNICLAKIEKWMKTGRLPLHAAKTQMLILDPSHKVGKTKLFSPLLTFWKLLCSRRKRETWE